MIVYVLTEHGHDFHSVWPTLDKARRVCEQDPIAECSEHDLETGLQRGVRFERDGSVKYGEWCQEYDGTQESLKS